MKIKMKRLEKIGTLLVAAALITSTLVLNAPALFTSVAASPSGSDENMMILTEGWAIQSSSDVTDGGNVISTVGYSTSGWYPTTAPTTVLAALVRNGVYPDPYYGTNINDIPSTPFKVPWWFRTEFELPADYSGQNIWLHLHSINYKANVWLNGHLIADSSTIEGAYRLFKLDLTDYALPGQTNCLAFEIVPPDSMSLTITWVDWNPEAPDMAMGIWYPVKITTSGSVEMRHPHVVTDLDLPSLDVAHLTISAELTNMTAGSVSGTLEGTIENVNNVSEGGTSEGGAGTIQFSKGFSLTAGETKTVTHTLDIPNPRIWWPNLVGTQQLYDLKLDVKVDGALIDTENVRFGVREISSWMNGSTRVFKINGEDIVIRGGGYLEDLMLQPSPERDEIEVKYAKQMNLNALRMEGIRGSDHLYDLCDKYGIMTQVGLCCCCLWEQWSKWDAHTKDIAEWSWRDEVIRLRNHPSVFTWLYGSDYYPPADVEQRYINVLDAHDPTRPYQSSATNACSDIAGCTGYYMGPWPSVYAYKPPNYWYGKLEFNCECGPSGEQVCPIESMRKMMPESDLWPDTTDSWMLRLHSSFYPDMRNALNSRYGTPSGIEEKCEKSQVLQYEATRAMFEAYARNRYNAAGVIFWQYNSVMPMLYWQFYDYYLRPNGSFYGTQEACESLHVMYAYDDEKIYVLNNLYESFSNLTVNAKVYNFDMTEKYSNSATISAGPDSVTNVFTIPSIAGLTPVYFLNLELKDSSGDVVSSNLYWLSTAGDQYADFTDLMNLPTVDLNVSTTLDNAAGEYTLQVTLNNPTTTLAFFVNPLVIKGSQGGEALPTYWSSNYFSILPGETKKTTATFSQEDLDGKDPYLKIEGWNVVTKEIAPVPDTTPPVISNVASTDLTSSSEKITWNTDELSDSVVNYGTTTALGSTASDATMVTSHSITLTGLSTTTTYYYEVKSTDSSGNTAVDDNNGSYYTFTTMAADTTPPTIVNVAASSITDTSATITWDTDELSDSLVKYGTVSGSYTDNKYDSTDVTSHSVTLTGLTENTTYYYVVNSTDPSGNSAESSEYSFTTEAVTGQAPYGEIPWAIPGKIEAEDYDTGGEGVAYHDTTSGNSGGACRSDNVDIESCSDTGGGYNVGWIDTGEWLEYTVNVASSGTYDIEVRVASTNSGRTFHIEFNGVDVTGSISVPNTGDWQSWTTVTVSGVNLSAGQQVMRVAMDSDLFNINYINIVTGAVDTTPPVISNVASSGITSSSATITWNTDELSDSVVNYGTTTALGSTASDATMVKSHSITLTGLSEGTKYYYEVKSTDGSGNTTVDDNNGSYYTFTTTAPDTTPPAAPTGLTATAVSSSQINLDWNNNTEADLAKYNVYRSTTSGFTPGTGNFVAETTVSNYSDTGLSASTTYYYKVTAVDTSGNESSPSAQASATTQAAPPPPTMTAYYCDIDTMSSALPMTVGGNLNSKTEATDAQYNAIGNSDDSRWTTPDPGWGDEVFLWLEMYTGMAVETIGSIELHFEGYLSSESANFSIWARDLVNGEWDQIGTTESIATGADGTITRTITANIANYIDADGKIIWGVYEDADSRSLNIDYVNMVYYLEGPPDTTPPAAPTGLTATAVSSSQINLDWNNNTEADLAKYNVYRSTTSGFTPGTGNFVAETTVSNYSDTGLSASTTYYYKVTAVDTSGNESSPSAQASATTEAAPSGNLALNQPVYASTEESSSLTAEMAVDGNTSTRWASQDPAPGDEWIYVDLGATTTISRVVLNWEVAYASAYQIQVSNDASSWTTIYSTSSGDGGIDDLTVSGTGRYVRVYCTVRGTSYGYSLWEFEIYSS